MTTRTLLRHLVGTMGAALALAGCGREHRDLTGPNGPAPSLSQQAALGQEFVSIDYPGTTFTDAVSISASGEILGRYLGADGRLHGFLLFQGTFTKVPDVADALESVPNRLNARGTIVGTYRDPLKEHAYVLSGGTFAIIDFPDPAMSLAGWGINDGGDVVGPEFVEGDFLDAHGYRFSNNTFTLSDVPGAMGTFPTDRKSVV